MDPFAPPPRRSRPSSIVRSVPVAVDVAIDSDGDNDVHEHSADVVMAGNVHATQIHSSAPLPSSDPPPATRKTAVSTSLPAASDFPLVQQPSSIFHSPSSPLSSLPVEIVEGVSPIQARDDTKIFQPAELDVIEPNIAPADEPAYNAFDQSAGDVVHQPTNIVTKSTQNDIVKPAYTIDASEQTMAPCELLLSTPIDLVGNDVSVAEESFSFSAQIPAERPSSINKSFPSNDPLTNTDCASTSLLRPQDSLQQHEWVEHALVLQSTGSHPHSLEIPTQGISSLQANVSSPTEPSVDNRLEDRTPGSGSFIEKSCNPFSAPLHKSELPVPHLPPTLGRNDQPDLTKEGSTSVAHANANLINPSNSASTDPKEPVLVDTDITTTNSPVRGGDNIDAARVGSNLPAQMDGSKISLIQGGAAEYTNADVNVVPVSASAQVALSCLHVRDANLLSVEDFADVPIVVDNDEITSRVGYTLHQNVTERTDPPTCVAKGQPLTSQPAVLSGTDSEIGPVVNGHTGVHQNSSSHANSLPHDAITSEPLSLQRSGNHPHKATAMSDMTPAVNLPVPNLGSPTLNDSRQHRLGAIEKSKYGVRYDGLPFTGTYEFDTAFPVEGETPRREEGPQGDLQHDKLKSSSRPGSIDVSHVDSPIDVDGLSSGEEDNANPVFTISDDDDGEDSDVEIVRECSADSIISENVKSAMSSLHFENVAVAIPRFTRCEPPSADDLAVLQAIADVFKEDALRLGKSRVRGNRSRNVLVVVNSIHRADKLNRFFHTHSELNAVVHGIQHRTRNPRTTGRRRRENVPFSTVFTSADLVITTDKAVRRHCQRQTLNLRDLSLIVLDGAEYMWDRSHPVRRFLRDYYRALPEFVRPRILAIVRRPIHPEETAPIEHCTYTKFVPSASRGIAWKSCYGKGSRKPEHENLDVEYIHYRDNCDDTIYIQGRRMAPPRATDRRGFTPLDNVADEVGPLGVALYRRQALERKQHTNGRDVFSNKLGIEAELGGGGSVVGLTQKMLSLLNELYEAYRASTAVDRLAAIIYAGKPVIACAVYEVIHSMPVFSKLTVRLVIGNSPADNCSPHSFEGFEYHDWQGEETDNEEAESFSTGETNILVVSENYAQRVETPQTPNSLLIIRFDGSEADPVIDGGGGPCRVIVFKDHTRRGDPTANEGDEHLTDIEDTQTEQEIQLQKSVIPNSHTSVREVNRKSHIKHANPAGRIGDGMDLGPALQTCSGPKQHTSKEERRNLEFTATETYYCRPPSCLSGLDSGVGGRVYLYRILLYDEGTLPEACSKPKLVQSGLENFGIALSERLSQQDTVMSLKDYHTGCGNGTFVEGTIHLIYQGLITLTGEKLDMVQRYTTRLFNLVDPTFTEEEFVWDSKQARSTNENDPAHKSFLRRYLILPVTPCNNKEEAKLVTDSVENENTASKLETREAVMKRYFEDSLDSDAPFSSVVKVDWKTIEMVLSLYKRNIHMKEVNPPEPVDRSRLSQFEGQILFSSLPHENVVLAGKLQYDVSPLSVISRSRKFSLNDDGTLKPCSDLAYLTKVEATEESICRQKCATGVQCDIVNLDEDEALCCEDKNQSGSANASKTTRLIPVKWCEQTQTLIPTGEREYAQKEASRFDCERNILKKRKYWTCVVRYNIEYYFNRFYRDRIRYLDQPLLLAALPRRANLSEFVDTIRGKRVTNLATDIVQSKGERRYLVPELCRTYPVSSGVLFLPCALYFIEQHLSICELRKLFDPHVGVVAETAHLVRAVTPSFRNNKTNYERLEFLGDSLFKLACTTRLLRQFICEDEGLLTKERNRAVANSVLKKCGQRMKIYNYFRFHQETDNEWRPPGTDRRGPGRKFQMKAVADVVEALCGAYFEIGVLQSLKNQGGARNSSKKAKLDVTHSCDESEPDESSDSDLQWARDSDSEDPIVIHDESGSDHNIDNERTKKRKLSDMDLETSRRRFTVSSVCHGYGIGAKFLERIGALGRKEPTYEEFLMATIRSMYPKGTNVPSENGELVFPSDSRLNSSAWDQKHVKLEGILGYEFKRRSLLICALTHGSYLKAGGKVNRHETYERLEFLGDAVADFFVACHVYERYPECSPGELTDLKGNVVSNESFARVSVTNGIHNFLDHNSGSLATEINAFVQSLPQDLTAGGDGSHSVRKKDYGEVTAPKVLGDVFEAVVGAVFVDAGLGPAWRVCSKLLRESLRINADRERHDRHPCNELVDKVRRVWGIAGELKFVLERGLQKRKKVAVYILGEKVATGIGTILKRAKLVAARNALAFLSDEDMNSDGAKMRTKLQAKALQALRKARQSAA